MDEHPGGDEVLLAATGNFFFCPINALILFSLVLLLIFFMFGFCSCIMVSTFLYDIDNSIRNQFSYFLFNKMMQLNSLMLAVLKK